MRFELAGSVWPRTGGDRANRSCVRVEGPSKLRTVATLRLEGAAEGRAGIAVAADGALRVCAGRSVLAVDLAGRVQWTRRPLGRGRGVLSAPLTTASGATIVTTGRAVVVFDRRGKTAAEIESPVALDDSGPSPNLAHDGRLIVASPFGDVLVLEGRRLRSIGAFGYDVLPPAVYDDDTLAVSGYAGSGFVRVRLDGTYCFRTRMKDADLPASIDERGRAAVGSLNDGRSRFFSSAGRALGGTGAAAVFAAVPGGGWIAQSASALAALGPDGRPRWARRLTPRMDVGWSTTPPIVDARGWIVCAHDRTLSLFDPGGRSRGSRRFPAPVQAFAVVAPGTVAVVTDTSLVLVG